MAPSPFRHQLDPPPPPPNPPPPPKPPNPPPPPPKPPNPPPPPPPHPPRPPPPNPPIGMKMGKQPPQPLLLRRPMLLNTISTTTKMMKITNGGIPPGLP